MNRSLSLHLFFICFSLFFSVALYGQSTVSGNIYYQETQEPVAGAVVSLLEPKEGKMLCLCTTDGKGFFSCKTGLQLDYAIIRVRSLGIETFEKKISLSEHKPLKIQVVEKAQILREVIVKAPLIRQSGDTITYMSAPFLNPNDRTLADLMKKLPGIQISESGKISYQGEPISKFYIEGLDMLNGRYGLATNNLDVDKVASVQILEKHQPLQVLQGVDMPDAAAINIKLKKSALGALFASVRLGAGIPVGLFSNQLAGMRFTRKQQNMLIYKQDNTGRNIEKDLLSYYENLRENDRQFLSIPYTPAPIADQLTRFNNAHYVSVNTLLAIDTVSTFSYNLNYKRDKRTYHDKTTRTIYTPNGPVTNLIESANDSIKEHRAEFELKYEQNSHKRYLLNRTVFKIAKNNGEGVIDRKENQVYQTLSTPFLNVTNKLYLIRKSESGRYRLNWDTRYYRTKNNLQVLPAIGFDELLNTANWSVDFIVSQRVNYQQFSSVVNLSKSRDYPKRMVGDYYLSGGIKVDRFYSDLSFNEKNDLNNIVKIENGENDIFCKTLFLRGGTSFFHKAVNGWQLKLNLPVTYQRKWSELKTMNYFRFHPSLESSYDLSSRWRWRGRMSVTDQVGDFMDEIKGYLLKSYNMLSYSSHPSSRLIFADFSTSFNYRDPLSTTFWTAWLGLNRGWSNSLVSMRYEKGAFRYENRSHKNSPLSCKLGSSIEHHFRSIKTTLKGSVGWIGNSGTTLLWDRPANYKGNNYWINGSAFFRWAKWLSGEYVATFSVFDYKVGAKSVDTHYSQSHKLMLTLTPVYKFNLGFDTRYIQNSSAGERYNVVLGSLNCLYKINKNMELSASWSNVFGANNFVVYRNIDSDIEMTEYMLRPSEFLISVAFSIL
ncbi:hypothetical protein HR11_07910 [Porphyromonas macacae]|uniref:carboxypeptidase-like regulatory domain-containing protein n=1 Tax=Porphyromonas macacae TaxID=28115 RepID=UPI00052C6A9F|nr:carboxypeptidase-like regulatory domain-containing protein [Porphyromonas macacae]KGO00110.1 hypothetical protein HR11_07910 [Porphyromonas macacae]